MWPFTFLRNSKAAPPDVAVGDTTARFDIKVGVWEFDISEHKFSIQKKEFPPECVEWARAVAEFLPAHMPAVRDAVLNELKGWKEVNAQSTEMLPVSLDDYASSRTVTLDFYGDDTWGDLGVTVVLSSEKIVEVWSGD
jgi:hypothetical protein